MSKHPDTYFVDDRRPPVESAWTYLYNKKDGTVLGRTGIGWVKLLIFYGVFYIVLAAVFSISMWVFFQTLDPRIPKWQLDRSIIGTNPGLGFRPMPPTSDVESTLIWYKGTHRENYTHWTSQLTSFLDVYRRPGLTPGRGANIFSCDYNRPPGRGQVCEVDVRNWFPCTQENEFNYHKSAPCIFLKLNKIYGWVPQFYNSTRDLPPSMPEELRNHIHVVQVTNPEQLNTVWVSCQGENPADIENLGPISYIPKHGFPGYFFPFENSEGYLSPPIAIHLQAPRSGILINIECRAWAKNIKHNTHERVGSVHLELMID